MYTLCIIKKESISTLIWSGSNDRTIKIWDIKSYECIKTIVSNNGCISTLLYLQSQDVILSGSTDSKIRIWDITLIKCIQIMDDHTNTVSCMIEIPTSYKYPLIASGSEDKTIRLWNSKTW